MSDDHTTPERRYQQPAPEHSGVIDAARIAESIRLIDSDMAVALRTATYEALGRVVLGNAASIARGDTDRVPTSEAVKAHVADALAGVIGTAPGVLDTLAELAQALGDDPDFAATVAANIASKADKAATETALADRPTKAEADSKYILSGNGVARNERVASRNFDLLDLNNGGDYWRMRFSGARVRFLNSLDQELFSFQSDGNMISPLWTSGLHTHIESRCDAYRTDTRNFVWQNYVNDIRLAGGVAVGWGYNAWVGGNGGELIIRVHYSGYPNVALIDHVVTKYLQKYVNGNWYTVGTV